MAITTMYINSNGIRILESLEGLWRQIWHAYCIGLKTLTQTMRRTHCMSQGRSNRPISLYVCSKAELYQP